MKKRVALFALSILTCIFRVHSDSDPDFGWIQISLHGPAEMLITDPMERRLGLQPDSSDTLKEIPNGSYFQDGGIGDDEGGGESTEQFLSATITKASDGKYGIQVIGKDSGTFTLNRSYSTKNGSNIVSLPSLKGSTAMGRVDTFTLSYDGGKYRNRLPPKKAESP